ncbi:MAG: CPBP family intramembrane metalloprotease [Deltaproteobacteria bacterium]|nr:MAG: CPBP family intramembrane metalloprotease [Deltaproteobacteria bacterium]
MELAASTLLVGAAAAWSAVRGLGLATAAEPTVDAVLVGVGAGLALAVTLPLVTAPWARRIFLLRGLRRAWDALESGIGPGLGVVEILVLALGSAVSEEAFFRGAVQREFGVAAASVFFGLLHPLGAAYIVWATVVGAGLGALAITTGGLVAPIAAHGTYNLLALTYLRRRSTRPDTRS